MTQQTTAERIEGLLERHLTLIPLMVGVDSDSAEIGGIARVSQTIAAEIDALAAERDAYREGYNRLTTQLTEARAEVERLQIAADKWLTLITLYEDRGTSIETAYSAARARAAKADALAHEAALKAQHVRGDA